MSRRRLFVFLIGGTCVITFFYLSYSFYSFFQQIKTHPITSWTEDHKADCAVALTGGPNRIGDAFELLYLKRVKKVIISGVNPAAELRDLFPQRYFLGDIDEDDIILEKRSLTTYGNAQQVLPLLEALNCKDMVLITSNLHMIRAYSTFRAHIPEEIPIYKRSTIGKRYNPHWAQVGAEALKTVFYDLWFY